LLGVVGKDAERDMIHKVQEGLEIRGNLSTASRDSRSGKTIAKHQRKCKNEKMRFL
jgi:hypothetical protein